MEAASMKRAIITTDSGTVPEYLIDGKNALIVPREREAFVQAVEKLRNDPALRMKLGKAARRAVISAWDWKDRSEDYRHFFREALRTAQEAALQPIAQPAPVKGGGAIQSVSQKETPERSYEIIRKVIQAGMVPEAMRALQELIQSHPGFASAHHDLGVLYHNSNEKEKALAHYEKAVSLDPEKHAFLQSLADFYVGEQNRTEDALQIYLRILKNDPSNIEMLSITGNLLAVTGNPDTAREYYLKILEMDPGNQNARENLRFLASMEQGSGRLRGGETEHRQGAPGHDFRVVAIISAHNEGDVIYHVIGDLIRQGVSAYLLDHRSTDNTVEEAEKWLGKGLLHIEKFPDDSRYAEENKSQYIWRDILKRKSELATNLDADWFIHADAY
jgi:tetratricopeptide (TPR) repeat protein